MKKKKISTKKMQKPVKKPAQKITQKIPPKKKSVKTIPKKIPQKQSLKEIVIQGKTQTSTQVLEQFFSGPVKLKLWKVFSLNTSREFTLKDLSRLTKTKGETLILILRDMMRQGVVDGAKKVFINEKQQKDQAVFYKVSKKFPLLAEITQLILTGIPRSPEKVISELQTLQRLKTVLLSGFFTSKLGLSADNFSATQSPIDMLLIFEKVPLNVAETISELEHKLGRDLRYAALDEADFKYRHSIGDKLIRDVLDFDHMVALDKLAFFK